jgi:beta-glucosidase
MSSPPFPPEFLWGASTSAYQVEGSPLADGAGPSIWHRFSHTPGLVKGGDTGDVACDHYRRYRSDVRLMRELGLTAYRFSISWSRVLPGGRVRVNRRGLDFYRRLVDALRENGIRPFVTLFHWDLPAALEDRGGWLNPEIADWFADYARVVYRALGGSVAAWATLNEPWVVTDGGYLRGKLAPGHRDLFEAPIASHNLLLAHGKAIDAGRAEGRRNLGIVVNLEPKSPASSRRADRDAAGRSDAYMNRQFLDPIFRGTYPSELSAIFGKAWPRFPASDLEKISRKLDFLGINYYTRGVMRNDPKALPVRASCVKRGGTAVTETGWEVFPRGLFDVLAWVRKRYGALPLYVTENGAAFADPPRVTKRGIHDTRRVEYLRGHLAAAAEAIRRGVDVRGYFVWSLLDNFEWSHGYSKRFGIVHVDYRTQKRTPKESACFYSEVIRNRGAGITDAPRPRRAVRARSLRRRGARKRRVR